MSWHHGFGSGECGGDEADGGAGQKRFKGIKHFFGLQFRITIKFVHTDIILREMIVIL